MEMCYDGALVMPSNYAVMGEDEMTYVEGGASVKSDPKNPGRLIILLSNKETKKLADYSQPASYITAVVPKVGPYIAAFAGLSGWAIGKLNKGKGVKIVIDTSCPLFPYAYAQSR